jgi:hypothetical protein
MSLEDAVGTMRMPFVGIKTAGVHNRAFIANTIPLSALVARTRRRQGRAFQP